jgi:hypothetical protein
MLGHSGLTLLPLTPWHAVQTADFSAPAAAVPFKGALWALAAFVNATAIMEKTKQSITREIIFDMCVFGSREGAELYTNGLRRKRRPNAGGNVLDTDIAAARAPRRSARPLSIACGVIATVTLALAANAAESTAMDKLQSAKSDLLAAIATHPSDRPVTPEIDATIKARALELETLAGVPNVAAEPALVEGIWICIYDTRDLLNAAGMKIMSGGQYPDARIPARATIQELHPARGLYRNTVALQAGPNKIAVNYEATATLAIEPATPNVFRVKFEQLAFIPTDARYSQDDVRAALGLAAGAPLVIKVPPGPASPSEVSYVDADLRINRGKTYISVLQRLR